MINVTKTPADALAQTRQKLKEAFDLHFAATIERAEKQAILAKYGRRLLNYLDDTPMVPGDVRPPFAYANQARQVLVDAEEELLQWEPTLEEVHAQAAGLGANLVPADDDPAPPGALPSDVSPDPKPMSDRSAAEGQRTELEEAVPA